MKTLLFLALIAAAVWYGMKKMRENAIVKAAQDAPVQYVKSLQTDVTRAQQAAAQATQAGQKISAEVQKAVDAQ